MVNRFFQKIFKIFRFERRQPTPMFPNITQICLFNKRLTLHQDFTQKKLQEAIDELQSRLHAKGYLLTLSGRFDFRTEQAVRKFQRNNHLFVDGVVGPLTWACLCYPKLSCSRSKDVSPDIEDAVKTLQEILREEGFTIKDADGYFGKNTERAVKVFQSRYGLRIDGVVGAISWAVLLGMRQRVEGGLPQGFYSLAPQSLFIFDQLLMVVFIVLGMYLNPMPVQSPPQLSNAVATAYALTYIVPILLERIPLKPLNQSEVPLLKYSPFIFVGMFWNSIFKLLGSLIEKLLLAI
jgi:peptidoglycan hydrolase-like protein with peptidoglycan-binding domain